jgi:hypothetical protein
MAERKYQEIAGIVIASKQCTKKRDEGHKNESKEL